MKVLYGKTIFIFFCGTLLISGNELLDIESIIGYVMIIISTILFATYCIKRKKSENFQFN